MKIGELAKATGLTTKAIRFYEGMGLIAEPARTTSGYRTYKSGDVDRLEFIHKAKRMGLSLEEIRGILHLHDRKKPTCLHVRSILDRKLDQVDEALRELREFREELARMRESTGSLVDCRPSGGRICGIVEQGFGVQGDVAVITAEGIPMTKWRS